MIESEEFIKDEKTGKKHEKEQDIYQRVKLLGSGAFGRAYLVKEKKTEQLYVIKQIDIADLTQQEQENARKQAKILEALTHSNIVKFKQVYGTSKMKLNIVMQYANGGDLASRISEAKANNVYFDQAQILNWFTQICLAIKHIHDRKIIHRDLKGQNIFLTEDNMVKIGDFGVAKVLQRTLAKAKTVVGSPYYLSPQIIENRPYSFKTDIWSLGALLFEMCALTPPFTANNIQFLALKIVKGSYSHIPPQYSADLKQLIRSMLNTNANLRPNIHQILSSPIIHRRIKNFLTQSQNIQQFSHTVLHNKNPLLGILKSQQQEPSLQKLRPPPNLLELQHANTSQVNHELKKNYEQKNKTPNTQNIKKKPIKYRPPIASRRNSKNTLNDNPQPEGNLENIMQIKPSQLQTHQLKLPKVPSHHIESIPEKKRPETPKISSHKVENREKNNGDKNITCGGFNKKKQVQPKPIFAKKQISIKDVKQELKEEKQILQNISSNLIKNRKVSERSASAHKKFVIKKDESKKNIDTKPKRATNTTNIKSARKKQDKKQKPLELISEEAKKKEGTEKKKQRVQKRIRVPLHPKKPKIPKRQTSEQKNEQIEENIGQISEEQKCQDSFNHYENQEFEAYNNFEDKKQTENGTSQDDFSSKNQQSDISLSFSKSAIPFKKTLQPENNNFNNMLAEMQMINKLVQQANGLADNLPIFGAQIPELKMQLSDSLRQDDSDLESANSSIINKQTNKQSSLGQTLMNLDCLSNPGQLQNLRIALEEIFGLQPLLYIYKKLQTIISKYGLDFQENQIMQEIIQEYHPNALDKIMLKKYFRHVVCVIALQTQMQFVGCTDK